MKINIKLFGALLPAFLFAGCVSETPFSSDREATLRLNVSVSSRLTRAISSDDEAALAESCVVYLSNEKGLLYKWHGLSELPSSLPVKYGRYTAEAWAGDSVSASFGSKFYKAEPYTFSVADGENTVSLVCRIANTVVSVNPESVNPEYISDWKVTVGHSRASLDFTPENEQEKGYFMMPWLTGASSAPAPETELTYTVTGVTPQGKEFSKEGVIEGVQPAHEYRLNFKVESISSSDGGAYIQIVVDDTELLVDDNITIKGRPSITAQDFDINEQLYSETSDFEDVVVKFAAFDGIASLVLNMSSNLTALLPNTDGVLDLCGMSESVRDQLAAKGIVFRQGVPTATGVERWYLEISKSFLNALPASDKEYAFSMHIADVNGKTGEATLSVANTKAALRVLPPVVPTVPTSDLLAIGAKEATLDLAVTGSPADALVRYREAGTSAWQTVEVTPGQTSVLLSGLKPDTRYEFQGCATVDGSEVATKSAYFITEPTFAITNYSFEDWSTYKASTMLGTKTVILPGNTADKETSFWGSGNEGGATAGICITDKSSDIKHSGLYSAKLESKTAVRVLAAGNIFVGTYVKTDGTDGVLSLGRPFNGSHPKQLSFWANYRPGHSVQVKSGNEEFLPQGFADGNDHGQLYVALTTEPVEIRTKKAERKLFDENDPVVVAYGQVTWTGDFGEDGSMGNVKIKLNYKDRAKTVTPKYIIVVASASKYGDFYSGSAGSLLYLDDFELEY